MREMEKYEIRDYGEGFLAISSPYNKSFSEEMKGLRARWKPDEKVWVFPKEKRAEAEAAAARCYKGPKSAPPKTLIDAVNEILKDSGALYSGDTVERLVAFAYYYGRETATKEVSDTYRAMIKEMRKRAESSRYTTLINEAIGDRNYIVFTDYPGRVTKDAGTLETHLLEDKNV